MLRILQRLRDCGNQAGDKRLIQDGRCFQYAENPLVIHGRIVLDKPPEGDTEALGARSKLDAENVPGTAEESNQNKQSGCMAIFVLVTLKYSAWNTLFKRSHAFEG